MMRFRAAWPPSLSLAFATSLAIAAGASQLGLDQDSVAINSHVDEVATLNAPSAPTSNPSDRTRLPADLSGYYGPAWAVPLGSLTTTRERPIFSPARRAPAVSLPSSPSPALMIQKEDRPHLSLIGAIAGSTDGLGIFIDETTKDIVRLRTGETHSGWKLRSVAKREATLQNGSETAVLSIPTPPAK